MGASDELAGRASGSRRRMSVQMFSSRLHGHFGSAERDDEDEDEEQEERKRERERKRKRSRKKWARLRSAFPVRPRAPARLKKLASTRLELLIWLVS